MSVRLAARRLALSGPPSSSLVPAPSTSTILSGRACPTIQRRHKWEPANILNFWKIRGKKDGTQTHTDPVTAELDDPRKRQQFLLDKRGSVEDNIFQDEIETASKPSHQVEKVATEPRTQQSLAIVTDPDPRSRIRWQRKKVIQMVRANGQLTKEETLKMTERELVHVSPFIATSLKKLVMLSRQIAGKTVDDAILQMTWSKKKMAAEIKYYLEEARDLAVAERGMGLGKVNGEVLSKPRRIKTKDGKWIEITDPTRMYIAQSWVGRGPWIGKRIDFKGRGRSGLIKNPSTSIAVVLKEEKTRMREFEEAESKKAEKGPWVHLPSRPLHGQRPYYTW